MYSFLIRTKLFTKMIVFNSLEEDGLNLNSL